MGKPKNAMEIFALLDKSNCRLCGEKTCLAFAGAVYTGLKKISECPHLSPEQKALYENKVDPAVTTKSDEDQYVSELKRKLRGLDYEEVATRVAGEKQGDLLKVNVLGKPFAFDKDAQFRTDLHIISWLVVPALEYVCNSKGYVPAGDWISFREIPGGREKYGLFHIRGEAVLKSLADKYPDFFDDVIHMFDGESVEQQFESDISVVLHPLPLVPMMICYWKPEEGMASSLNIFYDATVHDNLGVESAFFLGTGIAQMLEKIARHHGF
ncbi:DUF3786 domain-containing protein [Desulforhopalus sp. IMCC35007]|uniref:DUF3786 domain-containing protein n=1 Tax=Desulforhopalus sp. IMCC35007 TaxID=2569543 RepID=UPI0010AE7FFB|nr:DUF3786 domain-containing protein [Desulforhopalus sp. IMCC35007]TKB07964.1 DUF3786 domain-containing protein [Desulforhopalus sp. IMCC35007]